MTKLILILFTTTSASFAEFSGPLEPVDEIDGVPVRRAIPIEEAATYDATPASTPSIATEIGERAASPRGFGGILLALLTAYFLPAIVGGLRRHHNGGAIFVLNMFLGWTMLGWVIALVWAATNPTPVKR